MLNKLDASATQVASQLHNTDRRSKPRVACAYSAVVRGIETQGARFQEAAQVRNLSASGLYLKLDHALTNGRALFVVFWFSSHANQADSAGLAVRGTVVRNEIQSDGSCGIAVRFRQHRFI
ncbi:MAG: PilZ domain-containing protein [Chloroflexi bacterium]|nr:PilZ domain-containing protein [Chloroflexota bacterium]